jgi:hypothetical protein
MTGQGGIASSNGKGQIVIECSTLPIEVKARGEAQHCGSGRIVGALSNWLLSDNALMKFDAFRE